MTAPLPAATRDPASLEVCDVWTRFEDGDAWIHRGIDLEVTAGESVVVIGGSGSGKSTLLRHLDRALRAIACEKLKMVGLRGLEDRFPGQLSGGMCKRVGLARAIAHEPRILLCDEPTSGLDPVMADMISELIVQMKQRLGVTTLTITHDMASAYKIADRIAMLYEGRIRAFDVPEAIRASDDPVLRQFVRGRDCGVVSGVDAG
jgi:ABC-type transporter Mla maintaining outer membrane lipid asymmetry ATPase subunit MlaF